jgi:hypothetical protein
LLAWAEGLGGPVVPLADFFNSDPETAPLAFTYEDSTLFGEAQVARLPASGGHPLRLLVVYQDRFFAETGFAVLFADPSTPLEPVAAVTPPAPAPDAGSDAGLAGASGFKPEAPAEESDFFLSILAAHGYGAEDYLELYPDGAYAAEARAIVDGPRLILDTVSYADTDTISASFRNLPPDASANLTLLNPARDYAAEDSEYLPDATAGVALFDMAGRLAPGVYMIRAEVQFPDRTDVIVLQRDFSITAGLAELAIDKTEFAPGETITVRFSGMSGDGQDYISTAPAGAPNSTFLQYVYLNSAREGVAKLAAPAEAGSYELRAFFREDESVLRGSLPFTVAGAAVTPAPVTPPDPGATPDAEARATITLDRASYGPGAAITVTFAGMSGHSQDYVSTAPAGAANAIYLNYVYLGSAVDGVATLTAPTEPGAYEVRAFYREDETVLRGSAPFTVTAD